MPSSVSLPELVVALTVAFVLSNISMLLLLGKHGELLDGLKRIGMALLACDEAFFGQAAAPEDAVLTTTTTTAADFYKSEQPVAMTHYPESSVHRTVYGSYAFPEPMCAADSMMDRTMGSPVDWQPRATSPRGGGDDDHEPAPLHACNFRAPAGVAAFNP